MSEFQRDFKLTRRSAITSAMVVAAGLLVPRRLIAAPIDPVDATGTAQSPVRYFPETGHNLKNPFLTVWRDLGGKETLGVPLSEERYVEGIGIAQTFETVTLTYDPALGGEWQVQAQHLPPEIRSSIAPSSARRPRSGCSGSVCQFFEKTGHTLAGVFAAYWEDHGGLAIIGMPTTEPFDESGTGLTIQFFERAILEDHGAGEIRIRPTAAVLAEAAGLYSDPAFVPAPPTGGVTRLVRADGGLRVRTLPSLESDIIVVLPDSAEFIAGPGESGDWIGGYADGYAGWVSADFLNAPPPLPKLDLSDWNPTIWQGAALSETNVRRQPTTSADIVEVLGYGSDLTVSDWVKGEEVFTGANLWAQVSADRFIYARNVGRTAPVVAPPLPSDAPNIGKWIDVHLTQQLMTAYEGRDAVRVSVTTTGMAGWETPPGFYSILARVPNETMTSGAIGAEHYYKLEDVLFTQYFTDRGHAIHFAWWRTPETIGRPGSHGCLNLLLDDSQFFWDWADFGVPVYVHP